MGRNFAVLVIGTAFLATSEALSSGTVSTADGDYEEREILGPKTLMSLSKLAEKGNKPTLSKKLEHRSWLAAGESPQTLFKKNEWAGKTFAQLKKDPKYSVTRGLTIFG
ncbi:hypothetical protein PC129_g6925 [Phytophthora cactorum]|uniref:RxLR effector protein n=1 Tax=Phytophthora cactorum TaxID=29920 RepID=A0A8T1KFH4_9STRA|nr:hypothetical protein PC111_g13044 [Phytophthora cactorum]KAG2817340.1 hypothetical protein PC112_g13090 [Phytophthora cactorum]KAG2853243.1 hypothetical protein PC113_g14321 [Phytophthora cactorum]KAG2896039.1 hypothetical protein PC114_g15260 [Phytophthora cactorum]KAG2909041.1 hypothetical protein PC115_g13389 [Phytophthora cactorum]